MMAKSGFGSSLFQMRTASAVLSTPPPQDHTMGRGVPSRARCSRTIPVLWFEHAREQKRRRLCVAWKPVPQPLQIRSAKLDAPAETRSVLFTRGLKPVALLADRRLVARFVVAALQKRDDVVEVRHGRAPAVRAQRAPRAE